MLAVHHLKHVQAILARSSLELPHLGAGGGAGQGGRSAALVLMRAPVRVGMLAE